MALPRIFIICSGLAFLLMLVTYQQVFFGEDTSVRPVAPQRRQTADDQLQPRSFTPPAAAAAAQQAAVAKPVALAAPTVTATRVSAPAQPMTSVLASAQHGRLSGNCVAYIDPAREKLLNFLPAAIPAASGGRPGCLQMTPICEALRHAFASAGRSKGKRRQLVVTAAAHAQVGMLRTFAEGTAALRLPTLVLAMDEATFAVARATTAAAVLIPSTAGQTALSRKWAAIGAILEAGAGVLWADVDGVIASEPFALLSGDSDVEALSEGWEDTFLRGFVMGSDDPSMGWSRYCESMRAAMLSPSLMYLEPTTPSRNLAGLFARHAAAWPSADGYAWEAAGEEATELSMELLMPAHDATARVGVKLRVMHADCWLHERTALARSVRGTQLGDRPAALMTGRAVAGHQVGVAAAECRQRTAHEHVHKGSPLGSCWSSGFSRLPPVWTLERTRVDPFMSHPIRWNATKELVLRTQCNRVPTTPLTTPSRPLNWLVPTVGAGKESWPTNCDSQPRVCEVVKRVHKERAVMVAVSNRNILGMLGQFVDTVQKAKVSNFLVVALDQQTAQFLEQRGAAHYVRELRSRSGSTDNHATSGLKFKILGEILSVGASVLLTDVDVVLTRYSRRTPRLQPSTCLMRAVLTVAVPSSPRVAQ